MSLLLNMLENLEIQKTDVIVQFFSEKDLAELAFNGLRSHIKEKLEEYEFLTINQVLQMALAQES